LPDSNFHLDQKKAFCPFSAIFAPLREPVFLFFGIKDQEQTKQNGPRQLVFVFCLPIS